MSLIRSCYPMSGNKYYCVIKLHDKKKQPKKTYDISKLSNEIFKKQELQEVVIPNLSESETFKVRYSEHVFF